MAYVCALPAKEKPIGFGLVFFLGLILSPLIGLIIALASTNQEKEKNGVFAILSFTLAIILGFYLQWYLLSGFLSFIFGIIGIIDKKYKGLAITGVILSILLFLIFMDSCVKAYEDAEAAKQNLRQAIENQRY